MSRSDKGVGGTFLFSSFQNSLQDDMLYYEKRSTSVQFNVKYCIFPQNADELTLNYPHGQGSFID